MTKEELERALTASEAHRQEQDHEIRALKELLRKQDSEKSDLQIKLQAALAPIRRDTYSEAVRTYGKQSQLIMAMEEMADVEIMLEQLKIIFGNRSEVDRVRCEKLDRLIVRLTDELA